MTKPPSSRRRRGRPPKGMRGDTRQELLDAALRLFSRQGYAATTVRQIADEVGIRDSAIYAHFEAKRDLLEVLVEEAGASLVEAIEFDVDRISDRQPRDVLPKFCDRLVSAWDEPRARELMSLLVREGFEHTLDVFASLQARLAPHVERWVRDGYLRDDVAASLLVWELTTPLLAIRVLHHNARASAARRAEGRRLACEHVEYFLAMATGC